jgi:iron complex outermembrane receptor protein
MQSHLFPKGPALLLSAVLVLIPSTSTAQNVPPPTVAAVSAGNVVTLDAFVVNASAVNGYRTDQSTAGTLIAVDLQSIPVSIQVVTPQLQRDMSTRRVEDSIRFVSNVGLAARNEVSSGGASRSESFTIRGFRTAQVLRDGMRLQGITNSANIERVEVLKGPSSIFFGAADPGGVVNIVTKKPFWERKTSLKFEAGSYGFRYAVFDHNQPLVDQKLTLRLMGSRLETNSWRRFFRDEQSFLSGVLQWKPTPSTRIEVDAQHRRQDGIQERLGDAYLSTDNPAPFAQRLLTGAALARSLELGSLTPTDDLEERANFAAASVTHTFGGKIVGKFAFSGSDSNRTQLTTVTRNRVALNDGFSYFDRPGITIAGGANKTAGAVFMVPWDFTKITNKLVVGYDWAEAGYKEQLWAYANNSPFTTKRRLFDQGTDTQIFGVIKYPTLGEVGTPTGPAVVINNPWTKPAWQQGVFAANQTGAFDGRLNVLAGVRWSHLQQQDTTAWIPQAGVNYAVAPTVSAYALYSESFNSNGRSSTLDPNSPFFPPESGVGKEVGVKARLFGDKLSFTLAAFRVDKTNIRRINSGAAVIGINGATLSGGERSEGLELDLVWTPTKSLSIIATAADMDARVVSDTINTSTAPDLNADGIPDTIGMPLQLASPRSYSVWSKYDCLDSTLKGLSAAVGYQYRGGPIPLDASFARRLVVQESYSTVDLMVAYETRVFARPVRFQLNVNNATDEFYFDKALGYADPRTWRFSISTEF